MKFLKALVVIFLLSLPFIYGYNLVKNQTWSQDKGVERLGHLPAAVTESSGLEMADEPGTYYTHNDHGTLGAPASIFKVSESGALLKTYSVAGAENQDWEDLTRDTNGNLYIADTGNNSGKRDKLTIYKTDATNPVQAEAITFSVPDGDQGGGKKGKKGKKGGRCDIEAVFWKDGQIYLVTKDNSGARLFSVPDQPGSHAAKAVGSTQTGSKITAADLSPDGKRLVLLAVGTAYLFNVSGSDFFNDPKTIPLGPVGQTEGLTFTDNNTFVFTNEGGEIFRYSF